VWLEDITGPSSLSEKIYLSLLAGDNALFSSDPDMPWRLQFRGNIEDKLNREGLMFKFLDCKGEALDDIGEFVLKKAAPHLLPEYKRQRKENRADFLKRKEAFFKTVFWARGLSQYQIGAWSQFVSSCKGKGREEGLFILEASARHESFFRSQRGSQFLRYFDYVKKQDLQLFTSILAEHSQIPAHLRNYAACVSACLCVTDAETAAKLMEIADFENDDPIDALERARDEFFSSSGRGAEPAGADPHPFSLLREGRETLKRRVWVAQLQTAFPAIELERVDFISSRKDAVTEALNSQFMDYESGRPSFVKQYGEVLEDPYEAELTTLVKLTRLGKIDSQGYCLLEMKEDEKQRLAFLRDKRNDLAHMKICSPQEMSELFKPRFLAK
jgi:hypothetical protein